MAATTKQRLWRKTTLGAALPLKYGKVRNQEHGQPVDQAPVYGSSGVIGTFDRVLTDGPTLIVGRKGSVGSVHYSPVACWPIDTVFYAEDGEDRSLPFFRYLLENLRLGSMDRSTAIPGLSRDDYNSIEVCLPPLHEQYRIVAKIENQSTRLNAGVTSLKRVQAALKRYRASVLKTACEGRLVPTEAEVARQEGRSYEPASELLARISIERRKHWESEQLAKFKSASKAPKNDTWRAKYKEPLATTSADYKHDDLPEGWTWATWDQVALSQNGRPFPSREYQLSGFKLLRPGNLHKNGKIIWTADNTRCMPTRWAAENPDLIVGARELVMNLTAQSLKDEFLGRVCLTSHDEECLLNQRLARLTPVLILPEYLLYLLKSWRFRRFVDGLNSGSLIQHMFTSQLAGFEFPLPPLAEQKRIVEEVERRLTAVEKLEAVLAANLKRAERLRQSMLQGAFSGQL